MRKRKKKAKFGIKFPNSKMEEIAFASPSRSGYVFGVTDSDQHITVVDEGKSISTHRTFQGKGKSDHLGRMYKSDITEKFWLDTLKIRKLPQDQLDSTVLYFTKKWAALLNMPDDVLFKKKETEKEVISHLDLEELFKQTSLFFQQLRSAPDEFIGLCPARKILTSPKMVLGLLENGKAVMEVDGALYEIDLSPFRESFSAQSDSVPNNPLFNILQSLGFIAFRASFLQRVKEKTELSEKTG
jgi:hypothetical protein